MCLVVGRSGEDEELMEALALAVQRPQRQLFTLLTWDNTLTKVFYLFVLFFMNNVSFIVIRPPNPLGHNCT